MTIGSSDSPSHAHIEVAYAGPAGVMDVDELAPALLGIGALCKRANELFNGDFASVSVNVRSDFKTASFGIDFDVVQVVQTAAGIIPIFTPENFKTAKDIAALIGLITVGDEKTFTTLLGLIKWLRGGKVTRVEPQPSNTYRITNEHGDNITINGDVGQLILNADVREAAHAALKPLEHPKVTGFQVKSHGAVVEEVPEEAVGFFHHDDPVPVVETTDVVEILADSTSRHAFEVIRPSFDPKLMWKMSDGSRHFDMHVDDVDFLADTKKGKYGFFAGTVIVGLYRVRSLRTDAGKIKTEYRLVTMIDVRKPEAPQPPTLFAAF